MSSFGRPSGGRQTTEEESARARLVASASREPEEVLNLRAWGVDPECAPPDELLARAGDLFAPAARATRRRILLNASARYIFPERCTSDQEAERFLGACGGRIRAMIEFLVSSWADQLRPKTWVDALSADQQAQYAAAKQAYDREIASSNLAVAKAKEAYRVALQDELLRQEVARERLRSLVRGFGVTDAPILGRDRDETRLAGLEAELVALGLSDKIAILGRSPS